MLFGSLLITNFAGPPIMLTQYDDASGDWVEATVNLTPYLGHTINIVWRHEVIGNSVAPRPGWLVDDVAILVTNELRGAVVVTNNLAQAPFSLAGPINRTGQGLVTVFSNTPAGFYSAAFLPVPYYLTPEPQSGARAGANNLFFGGEYTFSDFNHNDMSDDWELAYFGVIDSERTLATDTDLDGFTDHAEFLAGTDPTEPDSKLQLSAPIPLPNGMLRLQWPSVPGRAYRVEGCGGPMGWTPLSGWITATNAMTSFVRPAPAVGPTPPFLYRLEVRP